LSTSTSSNSDDTVILPPLTAAALTSRFHHAHVLETSADATPQACSIHLSNQSFTNDKVKIATWNVCSGRNERLLQAIKAIQALNIDVAVFTEVKLTGFYPRSTADGVRILASTALSPNRGGVALVWQNSDRFSIESERVLGPNCISAEIVTGFRRFLLIGCYFSPSEPVTEALDIILKAVAGKTHLPIVFMGDINVDLREPNYTAKRDAEIANTLDSLGLGDIATHFRQKSKLGGRTTWSQQRNNTTVRSLCDYILTTSSSVKYFTNTSTKQPRNFYSDHRLVTATLASDRPRQLKRYNASRRRFPTNPRPLTALDTRLANLSFTLPPPRPPPTCRLDSYRNLAIPDPVREPSASPHSRRSSNHYPPTPLQSSNT
jgi:exonuclease III